MSQAISKRSDYESLNGLESEYEKFSLNGLGDAGSYADFSGYTNWVSPPAVDPTTTALAAQGLVSGAIIPSSSGFNWDALLGNLVNIGARTGLSIASNITNPAYNTPGAFTRLADGTIIATAGNPITGSGIPSSLLGGSGISGTTILLLGGAVLAVVLLAGKK